MKTRKPIKPSGKPIARRNAARSAKNWKRAYHSKERVSWVRNLGCVYCSAISPFIGEATVGYCVNAHTVTGGRGRKADYDTIIPLCHSHHQRYDLHQFPFDNEEVRSLMKSTASDIQAAWLLEESA